MLSLAGVLTSRAQLPPPAFTNDNMVFYLDGALENFVTNGSYAIGENLSGDQLYIQNGAVLSTVGGVIGSRFLSTNLTTGNLVSLSTGGTWTNTAELDVGSGAAINSSLVLSNGGLVFSPVGAVGSIGGAYGYGLILGSGSVWSNYGGPMSVGFAAVSNTLRVANGGKLFSLDGRVGYSQASKGNVAWVTDPGSVWSNYNGYLFVGATAGSSFNSVVVSNRGKVFSFGGQLGGQTGCNSNNLLVTGPGSVWTNKSSSLDIGLNGAGNKVTIDSGGAIYNVGAGVDVNVGTFGSGNSLVLSNGAQLFDYAGYLSANSIVASNNTALVTDIGSLWTNQTALYVGNFGPSNSLAIASGGIVSDYYGYIGYNSGATNNTVTVSDSGSTWFNVQLEVGGSGPFNSLVVSNGGKVVVGSGVSFIGAGSGSSNNTVLVTGNGSVLTNGSYFSVGDFGAFNTLVVSNGGTVRVGGAVSGIGDFGGHNAALVTGYGSLWTNSGSLSVGEYSGSNSLVISNQGRVLVTGIDLGESTNATYNTALVTDSGSVLANGGNTFVGVAGSFNSLVLTNGGIVVDTDGVVGGDSTASNNLVLVTASPSSFDPSSWINHGRLYIGEFGSRNTLEIDFGGQVAANNVYIGDSLTNSDNWLDVSGGFLMVTQALDLRGGTLTLISPSALVDVGSFIATNGNVTPTTIQLFGGKLKTGSTLVSNYRTLFVGNGIDPATLQLKGASGVHTFTSGLEIRTNAVLTGCGTINGDVVVDAGGQVIAGGGGCTLTINGTVTNNGTMWAINGNVLQVNGLVVNQGTVIYNTNGFKFNDVLNSGLIIDAGSTTISQIYRSDADLVVKIPSVVGLNYQLVFAKSLNSGSTPLPIGSPTAGTGGTLTLIDPGGAADHSRFYQVQISK